MFCFFIKSDPLIFSVSIPCVFHDLCLQSYSGIKLVSGHVVVTQVLGSVEDTAVIYGNHCGTYV